MLLEGEQKLLTESRQGCCADQDQQTPYHPEWLVYLAVVCRKAEWSLHQCSGRGKLPFPWYGPQNGSRTDVPAVKTNTFKYTYKAIIRTFIKSHVK